MPKIDLDSIEPSNRTGYPVPYDKDVEGRWYKRLAPAAGLSDFGASHVTLEPGAWSSQRHWHEGEDELLVMIEGTAILVENDGAIELRTGDVAAFPKGVRNGHHLINRGEEPCRFVVIGGGSPLGGAYSDIDMIFTADGEYRRRDGSPYESRRV